MLGLFCILSLSFKGSVVFLSHYGLLKVNRDSLYKPCYLYIIFRNLTFSFFRNSWKISHLRLFKCNLRICTVIALFSPSLKHRTSTQNSLSFLSSNDYRTALTSSDKSPKAPVNFDFILLSSDLSTPAGDSLPSPESRLSLLHTLRPLHLTVWYSFLRLGFLIEV